MTNTIETTATVSEAPANVNGAVLFVPLAKLKKSPRNARKTPHSEAHIEALAASIAAKGMLQNLVVEPETNADGEPTGSYFVTIGEGRRLAQLLRVKRKQIKKSEAIRCVLDIPAKISVPAFAVAGLIYAGEWDQVQEACEGDVVSTALLLVHWRQLHDARAETAAVEDRLLRRVCELRAGRRSLAAFGVRQAARFAKALETATNDAAVLSSPLDETVD